MKVTDKIQITNEDNKALMSRYPDNYFELAIVDPPYGINVEKQSKFGNKKDNKIWDSTPPKKKYFNELKRVSKNQIIWGGNYFDLPPTRCFLIWDKQNGSNDMADAELAWTSFQKSVRMYRGHIFKGIGNTNYKSIHPTQKPVKLYEWLLMNYAKEGDKILDTHLGSGSIAIACHNLGFKLTACELDSEYYQASLKRIKDHISQQRLF
jgi:site-specific DNA-methyltransferase (adenine-specific)